MIHATQRSILVCLALAMASLICCAPAGAQTPAVTPTDTPGVTKPSQRLKITFYGPGIIRDVPVKEGDLVKIGQPIMQQDDRIERKALEALQLEANSTLQIEAAQTELAAKKVILERKQKMSVDNVASKSELEEAQLDVDIAEIKVRLAKQESAQKKLEADRQAIKVELMKLISPIDGIIEKIDVGPGELIDQNRNEGACTVVKNDPLWVEIHLPTAQAAKLNGGEGIDVRHVDEKEYHPAKVIYLNPVADAASDTRLVRLELPNPQNHASGLQVVVKLPPNVAAATADQSAQVGQ